MKLQLSWISNICSSITTENQTYVHMTCLMGNNLRNKILKYGHKLTGHSLHACSLYSLKLNFAHTKINKVDNKLLKLRSMLCWCVWRQMKRTVSKVIFSDEQYSMCHGLYTCRSQTCSSWVGTDVKWYAMYTNPMSTQYEKYTVFTCITCTLL
jgi:hypothetical protein